MSSTGNGSNELWVNQGLYTQQEWEAKWKTDKVLHRNGGLIFSIILGVGTVAEMYPDRRCLLGLFCWTTDQSLRGTASCCGVTAQP